MNRNTEYQNAAVPTIDYRRYKHNDIYEHTTTYNVGEFVPFFVDTLVQPGDTYEIKTSMVIRLTTPLTPTMGRLYLDYYYFYVPYTILWTHAKEFWGENKLGAWTQTVEYKVPEIKTTNVAVQTHTILDHFGWRKGVKGIHGTRLALSAYFETWNAWFRDQTVMAPIQYDMSDTDIEHDGTTETGGTLLKVCRFHDYFSLLPEPQKGTASTIPLGTMAPVFTGAVNDYPYAGVPDSLRFKLSSGGDAVTGSVVAINQDTNPKNGIAVTSNAGLTLDGSGIYPANLYTDLTQATAAAINALRLADSVQKIMERDAIYGTRLQEIYRAHWGINIPADLAQISEYLGGKRVPLDMGTVLQTSSTDATSPMGFTGAFSVTADADFSFTKSFTAHGVIIGVCCVRQDHQYAQRMDAKWNKTRKYDYYWNEFAHLGYQPVLTKEICATGTATDETVFGYKQPWQEYRVWTDDVTGEINPDYAQSLDVWSYVDDYANPPVYSKEFVEEIPDYVDRTIAIPHTEQDQLLMDCALDITKYSEVETFGIPGGLTL